MRKSQIEKIFFKYFDKEMKFQNLLTGEVRRGYELLCFLYKAGDERLYFLVDENEGLILTMGKPGNVSITEVEYFVQKVRNMFTKPL